MEEVELVINYMCDSAHLKEIGAVVTLCGVPVAGWFVKKFFFITQVGGRHGCEDCRSKYKESKR